jgi:cell division control protein 6
VECTKSLFLIISKILLKFKRIILLDELDYLMTKDQTILYNLFEWPHCKFAKMIMAGD